MSKQVRRDPFARETVMSDRVYGGATCQWCGGFGRTKTQRKYLHRYSLHSDGGRVSADKYLFCSWDCRNTYYT
jgi:hypothetical protein